MTAFIERPKGWLSDFTHPKKRAYEYNTDCVVFVPVKCPDCGSTNVNCQKKDGSLRYHICQSCNKKFKSIEN